MSKQEMVEAIRQRNRSAAPEFLLTFDEPTLTSYLRRLDLTAQRGRTSGWVRTSATPCVTARLCV